MADPAQAQAQAQASDYQRINTEAMIWRDFALFTNGDAFPMYGNIYPAWVLTAQQPQPQDMHHPMWAQGVCAVVPAALPMGCVPQFYPPGLVPITYAVSSSSNSVSAAEENTSRSGEAVQHDVSAADRARERRRSLNVDAERRRGEQQRQRILRLIICLQAGLLLALKFAVSVFMYNRSGSKDRLRMMMFMNLANLFCLYKMGAFTPLLRWLSRRARRAMMPVRHPAQTARVERNERRQVAHADERQDLGWQGLRKEFQMIVIGFVASLFPGFRLSDYE